MANSGARAARERDAAKEVLRMDHEGDCETALKRADALTSINTESALLRRLTGDLHYAAAIRARRAAGWDGQRLLEAGSSAAVAGATDLLIARVQLSIAKRLAPDCVETATALADALADSMMHEEAEREYVRALDIALPVDPALHNAVYGMHGPEPTSVNERVRRAREMARLGYYRLEKKVIATGVNQVFGILERDGAAKALSIAKEFGKSFPGSPRAAHLGVYMDLVFVRGLDPAIDKRKILRGRTLALADSAADAFPNSMVIACFRAKLQFVLGEYDAAERECCRALEMENPNDPDDDCIPLGSVSGTDYDARVLSLRAEFQDLNLKITMAGSDYWESMTTERQGEFMSVGLDVLLGGYSKIDQTSGLTPQVVRSIVKEDRSWRFWICPICQRGKFADSGVLFSHMCSDHPDTIPPSLQSVLDPEVTLLEIDDSLDRLIFCQDSDKLDIIRFQESSDMFRWLFDPPSSRTRAELFSKLQENKCSNATVILENIKNKLDTLPADKSTTKFDKILSEIQELWLSFAKASVFDYRETILALARVFQWEKLKKCMSEDPNIATKRISVDDIDPMFCSLADSPVRSVVGVQTMEMDQKREDDQQMEANEPSHSGQDLTINENRQESDVHVEKRTSQTMADKSRNKIDEKVEKLATDLHSDSSSATSQCRSGDQKETSGQSTEELLGTASYLRIVDALDEINADNDLLILHVITQSLWNLKHFRERFLRGPPVWILPVQDNPSIAEVFYHIFSAWEKNDHHGMPALLTSVKTTLCKNANDSNMFQKVGTFFAYDIMDTILKELHTPETCLHFCINTEIEGQTIIPITCRDCACAIHNLFGIKFHVQISCRCGNCSDEKEHITIIHKLDAGSRQTTKVKSFADLPVLWDEQFFSNDTCEHCESPKNTDIFLSNTPHFLTIVLHMDGCDSQFMFSEVLAGISSPLDIGTIYKYVHSTAYYTLSSMICYTDRRYVCFAHDQDRWLIYESKTVEIEDTWERLLERFKDCKLQPEVLFFEIIK